MTILRAAALLACVYSLADPTSAQDLDQGAVESAINAGQNNKFSQWSAGCKADVSYGDKRKDQPWSRGSVHFTGPYNVTALTNSGRIALLAADATRQRKPFGVSDVPDQFRKHALYVLVDPVKPGSDWGGGIEVPSRIQNVILRSKSSPASVAEPTSIEIGDVQWSEGRTILEIIGPTGRVKNLFQRTKATVVILMEQAKGLPPGELEIVVKTDSFERRCDLEATERLRLIS